MKSLPHYNDNCLASSVSRASFVGKSAAEAGELSIRRQSRDGTGSRSESDSVRWRLPPLATLWDCRRASPTRRTRSFLHTGSPAASATRCAEIRYLRAPVVDRNRCACREVFAQLFDRGLDRAARRFRPVGLRLGCLPTLGEIDEMNRVGVTGDQQRSDRAFEIAIVHDEVVLSRCTWPHRRAKVATILNPRRFFK